MGASIIGRMSELNENQDENKPASFDPSPNTEFLREKIKAKPINKKKLLRRTLFTVLLAAIFGVVACITFFLLEPVISERINRPDEVVENPPEIISFTDIGEDDPDEILPEDMYVNDTEMIEEALQGNVSEVNQNIQDIENMISQLEFGVEDYQKLYIKLRALAETVSVSLVRVTGITEEMGVVENVYENQTQSTGVIIADSGSNFLILVKDIGLMRADEIIATFWDGTSCSCKLLGKDNATDLLIVSVSKSALTPSTLNTVKPASLGNSRSSSIKGTPIIVLGAPNGIPDSISFGNVASPAQDLHITDADYKYLYTDVIGGENSSGIITTLRGSVIGFIDNTIDESGPNNVVKAIGISELKPLIEKMTNRLPKAYMGIQGTDVTDKMVTSMGLPSGIYINKVEMDSPAMQAGLQNGDILQTVEGEEIHSYREFVKWLYAVEPGTNAKLNVMRQSVDSYVRIDITVPLGVCEYEMEE